MKLSRWFAVGQADGSVPEPGAVAASRALVHEDPKLLIVFSSEAQDLAGVVAQIRARSGLGTLGTP